MSSSKLTVAPKPFWNSITPRSPMTMSLPLPVLIVSDLEPPITIRSCVDAAPSKTFASLAFARVIPVLCVPSSLTISTSESTCVRVAVTVSSPRPVFSINAFITVSLASVAVIVKVSFPEPAQMLISSIAPLAAGEFTVSL